MLLLRGCEKRVVYVKNTGDELFEEAYFFLKAGVSDAASPTELWRAAEKIVNESLIGGERDLTVPTRKRGLFLGALIFLGGFICGGGILALCLI